MNFPILAIVAFLERRLNKGDNEVIITFLIGNGFDKNLGLKTLYKEFLEYYLSGKDDQSELIQKFMQDIDTDKEFWANAESAFGEYTNNFNGDNAAVDFCDCHDHFCEQLAIYLENEEKKLILDKEDSNIAKSFAKAISSFYSSFRPDVKKQIANSIKKFDGAYNYNFISFNYTRTLDKFVNTPNLNKSLGSRPGTVPNTIGKLIHVHGYTDSDMVLGVDNEKQISNLKIFDGQSKWYKKQIIKVQANSMNERSVDENTHNIIKESDLFYIYGMSLGETDALWWQRIGERLKSNTNVGLIIHQHNAPKRVISSTKFKIFEDDVKNTFLNYLDFDETTKTKIRNQIYIDDTNIFEGLEHMALPTSEIADTKQQKKNKPELVNV